MLSRELHWIYIGWNETKLTFLIKILLLEMKRVPLCARLPPVVTDCSHLGPHGLLSICLNNIQELISFIFFD